jgi:hypothetical protein
MSDPLAKATPALKRLLAAAAASEPVAAMLELEVPQAGPAGAPLGGTLEATAMRRAAREHDAEALARHMAATLAALERLGLAPHGGRYIPFVAVRGPADAIRAALDLPGVVSATLEPLPNPPRHAADKGNDR